MSIKSTKRITRSKAQEILRRSVEELPNDTLGDLLDLIADSERSNILSKFDNFIVSEMSETDL